MKNPDRGQNSRYECKFEKPAAEYIFYKLASIVPERLRFFCTRIKPPSSMSIDTWLKFFSCFQNLYPDCLLVSACEAIA